MAIYGGKIYAINSDGSRTQTGSYEQTDVDLNDAAQELFHGNRQLWHNTAVVGNTLAVATGALMALPVAAEAAALPTMEVAVGKFVGSWHVAYRATGGPWSHGIRVVGQSGVEITSAGLQRFVASAWKISIGIPILDSGAVSATLGNVANSCARGACDGFLRGWGLK